MTRTKKLALSAMLTAMAIVLMFVSKLIPAPWLQGGSVTLASMVPIVVVSLVCGLKWGLLSGFVYSIIQMFSGFYPPPTNNFINFTLVVMLDYVIAFTVLGSGKAFYNLLGKKVWAISASGMIVSLLRYVCHILSGILIWGVYAEEGQSVLSYSLIYNGTYMIPEMIITTVVLALLSPVIKKYMD